MSKKFKGMLFMTVIIITAGIMFFSPDESLSGTDRPGIGGTKHDLALDGPGPWGGSFETTESCVFCHTPHNALNAVGPLWNKNTPASTTYTMYTSSTYNMTHGATIGAQSVLCMTCHDGIMAMNAVVNAPGRGLSSITATGDDQLGDLYWYNPSFENPLGTLPNISGNDPFGGNLHSIADEHPISFTYNSSADTQGNNFPANISGRITGGVTNAQYKLFGANKDQFECSTCHDVHDTVSYTGAWPGTWPDTSGKTADPGAQVVFFLRASNESSQMCRDCHQNK